MSTQNNIRRWLKISVTAALVTTGLVVIAGEITTEARIDFADLARATICDIGYDSGELGYDGNAVGVMTALDRQSPDIAQGVDRSHETRGGDAAARSFARNFTRQP